MSSIEDFTHGYEHGYDDALGGIEEAARALDVTKTIARIHAWIAKRQLTAILDTPGTSPVERFMAEEYLRSVEAKLADPDLDLPAEPRVPLHSEIGPVDPGDIQIIEVDSPEDLLRVLTGEAFEPVDTEPDPFEAWERDLQNPDN